MAFNLPIERVFQLDTIVGLRGLSCALTGHENKMLFIRFSTHASGSFFYHVNMYILRLRMREEGVSYETLNPQNHGYILCIMTRVLSKKLREHKAVHLQHRFKVYRFIYPWFQGFMWIVGLDVNFVLQKLSIQPFLLVSYV